MNPFSDVEDKPKCTINSKEYLDNDQIIVVKDALLFEHIRFQTAITIIMDSGGRREEVFALKYENINMLSGLVTIKDAFVKSKLTYNHIIKKVKTRSSERRFYITSHALELVKNLRTFKESSGIVVHDDDYLFTAWDSNELIAPEITSKEWRNFVKKVPVPQIPLKNLRDTQASFLDGIDAPIKARQNRS